MSNINKMFKDLTMLSKFDEVLRGFTDGGAGDAVDARNAIASLKKTLATGEYNTDILFGDAADNDGASSDVGPTR
ncbi:MAG: hypothetical protein COB50_01525 [Thiotrichales bacterium]|nr:MAG: hypothetical protein COB50_01525 [Thiotrichales bacterium]